MVKKTNAKPASNREAMIAASNSLKKSIGEIEAHLSGKGLKASSEGLRADLHSALADFAGSWYKKGFKRGHRLSLQAFEANGEVPKVLRAEVKRELFSGQRRAVKLRSSVI